LGVITYGKRFMASIYSTSTWSSGTTYNTYDIVKYGNYYYYSKVANNLNNIPSENSSFWGGTKVYNGVIKPHFIYVPSYNHSINIEPNVKIMQYGDGYEQSIPDGINNTLLKIELTFDLRNKAESQAINHFLEKRKGAESFVFTPSEPYNLEKLFKCRGWTSTYVFYDNYTIRCRFDEVPV
jgi:phage-related protein